MICDLKKTFSVQDSDLSISALEQARKLKFGVPVHLTQVNTWYEICQFW